MQPPQTRRQGFSLVEAIIAIAVLSVTLAAVANVMQLGDNLAAQSQIDSSALVTFGQDCQFLANVPISDFRSSLINYMSNNPGTTLGVTGLSVNLGPGSPTNATYGMLMDPPAYYLSQVGTNWAFPYSLTLKVSSPEGSNAATANYFLVGLSMVYSEPSILVTSYGATNGSKQLNFSFSKW